MTVQEKGVHDKIRYLLPVPIRERASAKSRALHATLPPPLPSSRRGKRQSASPDKVARIRKYASFCIDTGNPSPFSDGTSISWLFRLLKRKASWYHFLCRVGYSVHTSSSMNSAKTCSFLLKCSAEQVWVFICLDIVACS